MNIFIKKLDIKVWADDSQWVACWLVKVGLFNKVFEGLAFVPEITD
jgi:hypothetical protein